MVSYGIICIPSDISVCFYDKRTKEWRTDIVSSLTAVGAIFLDIFVCLISSWHLSNKLPTNDNATTYDSALMDDSGKDIGLKYIK